jgi:ABC-type branched-subunit amino acid transport system permease subunit
MAFALFCEKAFFARAEDFNIGNAAYDRLTIFGISTESDRANLVLIAVVFASFGLLVTALSKGRFGRQLRAMKDSPAAATTLGLDMTAVKLQVFALSAGMAGIGGALLAGWRGKVGPDQYALLAGSLPGLPLVLLTAVGGIAAVGGALLGGLLLAVMPLVGATYPIINNLMIIAPGLAGISLAANPDGAVAQTARQVTAALERRRQKRLGTLDVDGRQATGPGAMMERILALLVPRRSPSLPEEIPVGHGTTAEQLASLDGELGVRWGRCDVDTRGT